MSSTGKSSQPPRSKKQRVVYDERLRNENQMQLHVDVDTELTDNASDSLNVVVDEGHSSNQNNELDVNNGSPPSNVFQIGLTEEQNEKLVEFNQSNVYNGKKTLKFSCHDQVMRLLFNSMSYQATVRNN